MGKAVYPIDCDRSAVIGETRSEQESEQEIIGESALLMRLLQQIETVAPTDATTLVLGESGTGKELVARMIHKNSGRRNHPFVEVNCAAIPLGLLESELFGHERGAFTGAIAQRVGRFELADKGTLFLDEIADIPLELQPKLLRVLQDQRFERLGSTRTIRADFRLIAATHGKLAHMVDQGTFRVDLYYRLNIFPVSVPPLRERREDIPLLVWHFVRRFARRMDKHIETISPELMQTFVDHSWPGNVRELQNIIERAVILCRGTILEVPLFQLLPSREDEDPEPVTLKDAERAHIARMLRECNGVVATAAARLGVPRTTLFYKMRRLGIATHSQRA
jgi:formate hydrogenlyase transcriptional activator